MQKSSAANELFSTRGADELMGERLRLNTENTENTGPHIC